MQAENSSFGVVPFENSTNGSVVFTLDLLADLKGRYSDILVCGEVYLAVHHCLLGHVQHGKKSDPPLRNLSNGSESPSFSGRATPTLSAPEPGRPRVSPNHSIKHIKKLYSHPQAWGQCRLFLSTYLKGVDQEDVSSTSKAAERVAQDASGSSAAIASRIAADLNGLDVLAEGIEDNEGNSTRFLVLERRAQSSSTEGQAYDSTTSEDEEMSKYKSLVTFTLEHGESGALADCLAVFKKHNLNLTSINTRPSGEAPWHYIFFVEFMGRKHDDGRGGAVNAALHDLEKVAKGYRWLGSWENMLRAAV